ncbi:MAG: hypothetical protein R2857_03790 [Vampirovibrionales bacterium]
MMIFRPTGPSFWNGPKRWATPLPKGAASPVGFKRLKNAAGAFLSHACQNEPQPTADTLAQELAALQQRWQQLDASTGSVG